jgi:hypothetical protein
LFQFVSVFFEHQPERKFRKVFDSPGTKVIKLFPLAIKI